MGSGNAGPQNGQSLQHGVGLQTSTGRGGTARRPLDRKTILHEAVRFIDENGRDKLTMRRLGSELGVEAMALYRYVPGREQLLDGVVEVVMKELNDSSGAADTFDSWQEYLQQIAHAVRGMATAHPKIFPLVASRPPAAPWLRPPLRSLQWVESFLEGLDYYGFGKDASVVIYRAFSTFLLGHLLLESAMSLPGTPEMGAEDDIEVYETNDLTAYPRTLQLKPQLAREEFDEEFEDALEDLIDRIALSRT
jgi:AcrR family transcriptional regulator